MKKFLLLPLLFLFLETKAQQAIYSPTQQTTTSSTTGNPPGCVTDELIRQKELTDPSFQQRMQSMNAAIQSYVETANSQQSVQSVYVIPVVVHIIHNNGPENIPNAQVFQGIQDLNDAFSNSGNYNDPNGVNTGIQFCLAQQDEFGNASNGITRNISTLTNMTAETDDITLKNIVRWDPTKYLNIWLVNEITSIAVGPGVAGYAFFPSSHGQPEDGIVTEARFFGSNTNDSKITVHEAGHYFGLYHTFEGGCTNNNCLTDGDRVCDTPPDNSTATAICSNPPNSCTTDDDDLSTNNPFRPVAQGGIGDQLDMIENYMDYGLQACQHLFSNGQSTRMIAGLTTQRSSLLQSIGCQSLCTSPISVGFTMSNSTITVGGNVNFTNTSVGALNYIWKVNNVQFANTANSNYTFNTIGYYIITLIASNNDSVCSESINDTVIVQCGAQASFTVSPVGPYNPGATINFTNTSTGASNYEWVLDGTPQTNTSNFSYTFNNAGSYYVYLIADNGSCSDTSTSFFFKVGNCDLARSTDNWYFENKSMHFSGTTALPTTGTSNIDNMNGDECSASMTDPNGNMLFYTNGYNVWDHNEQLMPNGTGLLGDASSTQSCLVTPDPGNPNRYYIFTTSAFELNFYHSFRYTIVDMTLNSGLGDVVTTSKNILIHTLTGEKVSATFHANGHDIWVATNTYSGDSVLAYLLTASGLSTTPVISIVGSNTHSMGLGGMKFSHDGNRLALCIVTPTAPRILRITDFNKATGVCSNNFDVLLNIPQYEQPYDVEFSPDNSKLYCTMVQGGHLYQFDMGAGGPSAIAASKTAIDPYTQGQCSFAHIELGSDGRIYDVRDQLHIDYIPYPNLLACGFVPSGIYNPSSIVLGWCLPNFMRGLLQPGAPYITGPDTICGNTQQLYNLFLGTAADSAVWSYSGDGTLLSSSDSTATILTGTQNGNGMLMVTNYGRCGVTFDTLFIHVDVPQPSLGADRILCPPLSLSPGTFTSYLWQNNTTSSSFNVTTAGTYWVTVSDALGCSNSDTVIISPSLNLPAVNLGNDVTVCLGHTATFQAGNGYVSYTWQDGSHNSSFTAFGAGTYWVSVDDGCTITRDSVHVYTDESGIPLDLGNDTIVCVNGFPFTVNAPSGFPSYLWSDNSTANSYSVTGAGQIFVTVTDANGCSARDTLNVTVSSCSSTNDVENSDALSIFPNPADQFITVEYSGLRNPEILIYNSSGQMVYSKKVNNTSTTSEIEIGNLSEGLYLIEIQCEGKIIHKKLLIMHN